jgi:hypothetical protein
VAKLTPPGLHGVSVRVVGIRLGLRFSTADEKFSDVVKSAQDAAVLVLIY